MAYVLKDLGGGIVGTLQKSTCIFQAQKTPSNITILKAEPSRLNKRFWYNREIFQAPIIKFTGHMMQG
jgi:hypothetical protein